MLILSHFIKPLKTIEVSINNEYLYIQLKLHSVIHYINYYLYSYIIGIYYASDKCIDIKLKCIILLSL